MIKVGLVGYGFMGKMHSECYQATGEAKVVAVADVEPDRREDAKAKYGCETYESIQRMLASADIDVVDICTPTYLHEEHVAAAAASGRDIMCEKPMSLGVESCDRIIAAVNKAGVKMMVGQVIRFWPEYQVIKELVDSGKHGKVLWLSATRRGAIPTYAWRDWYAEPAKSGGAILDLHIHDLDYISYLVGSPKKVQTRAVPGRKGALDTAMTLGWGHGDGITTHAEGTLALAPGFPFTMALLVACEKAAINYDLATNPTLMVFPFDGEPFAPKLPDPGVGASSSAGGNISDLGGYFNEIKYFVDCLKAGKKLEIVTPETAREAVRICLAARKSAETGEIVSL